MINLDSSLTTRPLNPPALHVHFKHYFPTGVVTGSSTFFEIYTKILKRCKEVLERTQLDWTGKVPHSLLLVGYWIVVTPRRRGNAKGLGLNTAGTMGMPAIAKDIFMTWMGVGLQKCFASLVFPADTQCAQTA